MIARLYAAMLSKKAQYALKAIGYLVDQAGKGPVAITEIAGQKKIPLKFLESILLELRRHHILESKKGKGGGYYLDKPARSISIATVIRAIDGPISLLPCVSLYFYQKCEDCEETCCSMNRIFTEARDALLKVLEKKSLCDLATVSRS